MKWKYIIPMKPPPVYNANLFISQYCAARNSDFRNISLADMEAVLRRNKKAISIPLPGRKSCGTGKKPIRDTNEKSTVTEKWMIYTISYNGEAHFADNVFQLTDEQKELAADYASNLSLFLGDGMLPEHGGLERKTVFLRWGISGLRTAKPLWSIFNQMDERCAGKPPYGTDHIGEIWTGPSAMSIVVSSLTEEMVDPVKMADWAYKNGYWCKGKRLLPRADSSAAAAWGFRYPAAALRSRSGLLTPCRRASWWLQSWLRAFYLVGTFYCPPGRSGRQDYGG